VICVERKLINLATLALAIGALLLLSACAATYYPDYYPGGYGYSYPYDYGPYGFYYGGDGFYGGHAFHDGFHGVAPRFGEPRGGSAPHGGGAPGGGGHEFR